MMTITFGENGSKECIDNAGIQRNKLRVDTRLKLLAKWNPRKYGERVQQDVHLTGDLQIAERLATARKRK